MTRFAWSSIPDNIGREELARILNLRLGSLQADIDTRAGRGESVSADAPVGERETLRYVTTDNSAIARAGWAEVVEAAQPNSASVTARRTHVDGTLASGVVAELVGHHIVVRKTGGGTVTEACGLKVDVSGATTNEAICIVAGTFVTAGPVCVESSVDLGDELCAKVAATSANPSAHFYRARGDLTTPLAVTGGDPLMNIDISGHDGTNYARQALIEVLAHAAWGGADRSTRMGFYTTAQGSTTLTERLRIHHDGLVEAFGSVVIASAGKLYSVSTDNFLQPDDGSGNLRLASRGNLILDIDSDNNQTDRLLQVTKDAGATALLNVRESGQVEVVTGPLIVGTDPTGSEILRIGGGFLANGDSTISRAQFNHALTLSTPTNNQASPNLRFEARNAGGAAIPRYLRVSVSGDLLILDSAAAQTVNFTDSGNLIIGTDPGGTKKVRIGGGVNLQNASQISWRNVANSADIKVLSVTAADVTELNAATGQTISLQINAVEQARVATTGIVLVAARDVRSSSSAEQFLQPDDGSGNLRVNSRGNVFVVIDSDNNATTNVFDVYHHGTATVRLRVNESGQVLMPDGTAALPAHSFLNNTNMGMYRVGANSLGLAVGGIIGLQMTSTRSIHGTSQPRCRVFNSTVQSIGTGAFTTLAFNSEDFDTGSLHDTATNNSRITVPATGAGIWVISATVDWGGTAMAAGTIVRVRLLKDGVAITGAEIAVVIGSSDSDRRMSLTWLDEAAASAFFEVQVFQNTGGSRDVDIASRFMAAKLW